MTDKSIREAEASIERIHEQIEALPPYPPVVPLRTHLWVSLIQNALAVMALVGLLFAVNKIEHSRIIQCNYQNEFRIDVAALIYDAKAASDNNPSRSAAEKVFANIYFDNQIRRFELVNCKNPEKARTPVTQEMARQASEGTLRP